MPMVGKKKFSYSAKGKKAAIKRARREGIVIEDICSDDQVRQFYHLHSLSMKRGEQPARPFLYYKNLISVLKPKGLATGFLALHPSTKHPIASVILSLCSKSSRCWSVIRNSTVPRRWPPLHWDFCCLS